MARKRELAAIRAAKARKKRRRKKKTAGSHPLFRDNYTDYADGNGIYHGEI